MPPTDFPTSRSTPPRRTKPVLVRELASGAVLGALVWLALQTLGFHSIFHLSSATGIGPAALVGSLIGVTRHRVWLWVFGTGLAGLFALVAFTPIIVRPTQALIRSDALPTPPLRLDAVVVLGGGVTTDGLLPPDATDRMLSAIWLAKVTGTKTLVTTRARSSIDPEIDSDSDHRRLVRLIAPELLVVTVSGVLSTRDEAVRIRDLASTENWARVAVVTSPAHSRRACGTFEKVGLRVTCVPSDSRRVPVHTLTAPGDRVAAFQVWIYEIAGTVNHRIRGWLP